MDPLTIATSVIAFVDFGSKLVSLYQQMQQSENGRPRKLADLEQGLSNLSQHAADAKAMLTELGSRHPRHSELLDCLCEECDLALRDLQGLAESLTARAGRGLKSQGARISGAIRALRKENDVELVEGRMRAIREQMVLVLILCTLDSVQHLRQENGQDTQHVVARVHELQHAIESLPPKLTGPSLDRPRLTTVMSNSLSYGLWTSIPMALEEHDNLLPGHGPRIQPQNNDAAFNAQLLNSLQFNDMRARSSQIAEPFPNTFQWLLADPDPTNNDESSAAPEPTGFRDWLQSSNNEAPFWITGIPASGKSTLIKFMCTHPDVPHQLRLWAKNHQLLTCNIYFWNAGSSSQKSQRGLLLTMLHQILSQRQDLCKVVSPERYIYHQLAGSALPAPADWTLQELQSAIFRLMSKIGESCRLALFVDGLDEYEGDLRALVAFLKKLHAEHAIKLCISSRPWNLFRDEFAAYPSLRMERFNRADIREYVHTRMVGSRAINELARIDRCSIQRLESRILDKANGVFLWVVLVVETLLSTAENNNDLAVIWKLFEALPPGLEDLYDSMRRRLDQTQRQGASKMYQLVLRWTAAAEHCFDAGDFWVAINCQSPAKLVPPPPADAELPNILEVLERRVTGCTGGMLQVIISSRGAKLTASAAAVQHPPAIGLYHVDFLHRTVYDWLQQRPREIARDGPPGYDTDLVLASVVASRLKSVSTNHSSSSSNLPKPVSLISYKAAFYHFYRCISSSSWSQHRNYLIRMFEEIPPWEDASDEPAMSSYPTRESLLALTYACTHYLEAKLQSGSKITGFEPGCGSRLSQMLLLPLVKLWSSTFRRKRQMMILCNAALNSRGGLDERALTRDTLNARLKMVELLIKSQSIPVGAVKRFAQDRLKERQWPRQYWQAILDGIQGKGSMEITDELEPPMILDYGNLSDPDD